jgi:uncharacterized membrane protein
VKTNYELKQAAKMALKNTYWYVFVVILMMSALLSLVSTVGLSIIILGPVMVGYSLYLINVFNQKNRGDVFEDLLLGFKQNFINHMVTYLLMTLFIFLWSLLLIIPGIIKSYAYSQVGFILADDPTLTYKEALSKSEDMMRGHKLRLFSLQLSFIGWFILGLLTFGIVLIFLTPYYEMTRATFYEDLIKQ